MYTVQYFFLSLVAYCHDMVAVSALRDRGIVHMSGPVAHSMEEAVAYVAKQLEEDIVPEQQSILQDEEDGELRWINGISVQENDLLNMRLAQYRQVTDILNHGIDRFKGNPEVDAWLKEQGGLTKLNERLCGRNLTSPRGWYASTKRYFKRMLGYEPAPLGERQYEQVDSATNYSGYAVNVHRTMVNQKAYGELPDLEGENDWATTELDIQVIPGWYFRLSPSKKLVGLKAGEREPSIVQQLIKNPDVCVRRLRPMYCTGPILGESPYTFLYNKYSDAQIDRNPTVQDLWFRFKNEPERMLWKEIPLGRSGAMTWLAGIRTPKGMYLWMTLSKKSNEKFNFFTNDGKNVIGRKINFNLPPRKKALTYDKYNLVKGHMSIRTKKDGDDIRVIYEATKEYVDRMQMHVIQDSDELAAGRTPLPEVSQPVKAGVLTRQDGLTIIVPDDYQASPGKKPRKKAVYQDVSLSEEKTYTQIVHIKDDLMDSKEWGGLKKRLIKKGWKLVRVRTGNAPKDNHKEIEI